MTRLRKDLPEGQLWILHSISNLKAHGGGVGNWAGTSQGSRAALVKKGLITNLTNGGRHVQWSRYAVTELGLQVLCAVEFDKGLAVGFEKHCEVLDSHMAQRHEEALNENRRWDVAHGRRYAPSDAVEKDVHAVIWKHVAIVPE